MHRKSPFWCSFFQRDAHISNHLPQCSASNPRNTGFKNCRAPLEEDEMETLAMSMDFTGEHKISYCVMPKIQKFYGGGLLVCDSEETAACGWQSRV